MGTVDVDAVALIGALPVAGGVVELDGTVVAVNAAAERLLGRPAAALVGHQAWGDAPGGEHAWGERLAEVRAGRGRSHELAITTAQGVRTVEYEVGLGRHQGREVLVVCAMDITRHLRALDADSAQRLEALGLVAGGISHDFNNQLVSVLAEASAAREDQTLPESTRHALRNIEAAATRMAQLNRQLLAYAGRGRFVTEQLDPDELVRGARDQLARIARLDAELVVSPGAGKPVVQADRTLLAQVLANLAANASEALGPDGGRVTISTSLVHRDGSSWWQLEVADNGTGIEPATLPRIFDPFFSTKRGRHGLGLSAVHGIVRRLGGDIEVDSRPGKGARFRVRLPIVVGAQTPRARLPSDKTPALRTTLSGVRVLVADDEPSVRATVQRLLERRGATVVLASDGTEAETCLADGEYALLVFDVMMPGRTGYDLVPIARRLQPGAALLLMSGYSDQAHAPRPEDEPDVFLEKPFSAKTLDAAIDEVLARKAALPGV